MSNQYLKLRRSNVPGKIPTTESIDFGEIALNTYDGLAYMKKSGSNGIEVVPIGSSTGSFSGNFTGTFTGSLQGTASWANNALTASTSFNVRGNTNQIAFFDSNNSITSSANLSFSNSKANLTGSLTILSSGTEAINLGSSAAGQDQPVDIRLATGNARGLRVYASDNELTVTPNGAGFQFFSNNSVNFPGQVYFDSAANNSAAIIFRTSQTSQIIQERMRITSAGNVMIGSPTDSGFRLDVNGTVRAQGSLYVPVSNSIISNGLGITFRPFGIGGNSITFGNGSITIPQDHSYIFSGRATISSPSANNLLLTNSNNFSGLYFGAVTGSLPSLRVGTRNIAIVSGDGTGSSSLLVGTTTDVSSSILTLSSTTRGFLPPRMTSAQRTTISSPAVGLIVYETGSAATEGLWLNETTGWQQLLTNTGSQSISGSLTAASFTGSLQGTASWALNAISSSFATLANYAINAATASNILGGKAPHVPYFNTDTTLATSSIYQSGSSTVIINQDAATTANPEALYVWQPSTSSINVISGKGNLDNYLQLNIQNTNQGPNASSDVVATANNGSETDNYIDMGINSENFAGFLGGPNDSYVYSHGHDMWIGNINDGYNLHLFNSSSITPLLTLTPSNTVDVNTTLNAPDITGSLEGTASWAKNVISASHAINADFAGYAQTAGTAANGGVTQIIAGSGITVLPSTGVGAVTVIAGGGGGGVTILSGSNVTQSFSNSSTWNFTHNLGVRTPVISVFDSNYNQVIPQGIQLIDTASAIITFPTLESGFAIATVGGVSGNALSSSYSLFSTYADTASFYAETDPVFVARSASLATTGSNVFRGTQTISGSLILVNGATGSLLGTASYALNALSSSFATSASYALSSSYASNADLLDGKDSTIFATTGSNTFIGNQIVTGSLFTSGSNTLVGNTVLSGSINISGSQTFYGTSTSIGTQIVTGSLLTSGSQTLVGNTTLSGSINVSGSQTFYGTSVFYGNHILSGSNTILGNTVLSGSLEVSGSTILHNSSFIVTGSTFINGTTQITGSTGITGSFSVRDGDINIVSGSSFTRWGNKLFNYGQFVDTTTQSGSANTAYAMKFNTTEFALNTRIVSESRITVDNTGIYNLQFSAQLSNTANTNITFDIWFAYTGSNIAYSNTQIDVNKSAGQLGRSVAAWNLATPIQAGDYVEIYWSCNAATGQIVAAPAQVTPTRPAIPSIIATLTQIA